VPTQRYTDPTPFTIAEAASTQAPTTVTVTSVANPVCIGDHAEAYGSSTAPAADISGAFYWNGQQVSGLTTNGSQFQSTDPIPYVAGMANGDSLTAVITPKGGTSATATWTLTGVQAPDSDWSLTIPAASNGDLPPLADNPAGGTIATETVNVTRTGSSAGQVTVGGNSVFNEGGGYFDQTWTYTPQTVTVDAGQTVAVTLQSTQGIEPVYPGHVLQQTFHLSTGQTAEAQLPIVALSSS